MENNCLNNLAIRRITKELKNLQSEDTKNLYKYYAHPIDESNISIWNLELFDIDEEKNSVHLRIHFNQDYPFSPPFVYINKPAVSCTYVFENGAICMELLTQEGWSQATNIHTLAMSIRALLNLGKITISKNKDYKENSFEKAKKEFMGLSNYHIQNGWSNLRNNS